MSNAQQITVEVDGARNYVVAVTGQVNTEDVSAAAIIDPALMGLMAIGTPPKEFRIDRIVYSIQPGFQAILQWDATTPVYVASLSGAGHMEFEKDGGLKNNSGAGKTGKLLLSTNGYSSGTLGYSLLIECVKTQ